MSDTKKYLLAAGAISMVGLSLYLLKKGIKTKTQEARTTETVVALLGDIGGTNVRLTLKRLCLKTLHTQVCCDQI